MASATRVIPHPRRFGFVIFNVVVIVLIAAWLGVRLLSADEGLAGLPNFALTTAGIAVLVAIWLGSWIAWGFMVWSRRRARAGQTGQSPPSA